MFFPNDAQFSATKTKQFVFTGTTYPSLLNGEDTVELLTKWVPSLNFIQSPSLHCVPDGVTHTFVDTKDFFAYDFLRIFCRGDESIFVFTNLLRKFRVLNQLITETDGKILVLSEPTGSFNKLVTAFRAAKLPHFCYSDEGFACFFSQPQHPFLYQNCH